MSESLSVFKALIFMALCALWMGAGALLGAVGMILLEREFLQTNQATASGDFAPIGALGGFLLAAFFLPRFYRRWYLW